MSNACPHCGKPGKTIAADLIMYECLSSTSRGYTVQSTRCQLDELDRLRSIVGPLERMLATGHEVAIEEVSGGVCVAMTADMVTYYCEIKDTLAEALAAAAKELEGPKE